MQGKRRIVFAILAVSSSDFLSANESQNIGYSAYLKTGSYSVNDPDGSTDSSVSVIPGIKVHYNLPARGQRVYSAFEYLSFKLDPTISNIGQNVDGYAFLGGYEHRLNLSRDFKWWLGASFSVNQIEFSSRHTVNNSGFLGTSFSKRNETYIDASLTADTYYDFGPRSEYSIGVGVFYDLPFSDGVEATGIKINFQFK